jgi:phage tail protein X
MTIYTTVDGDTIDLICHRHYGRTDETVERILTLNRHLENHDATLPAGVKITLPIIEEPKSKQKLKLWQ